MLTFSNSASGGYNSSRALTSGPPSQEVEAAIGSSAQLKCLSLQPFNDCKFVSPRGKQFRIGIGSGSAYHKRRVDCWEDYDPTKVCAIIINNLKDEDMGEWRLVLEPFRVLYLNMILYKTGNLPAFPKYLQFLAYV